MHDRHKKFPEGKLEFISMGLDPDFTAWLDVMWLGLPHYVNTMHKATINVLVAITSNAFLEKMISLKRM
jgi:hypothetical protein